MLLVLGLARAASLDNLEIGGPWGSPTATDGTAGWWNPAGFAAGKGTRIELEGAPTFAVINFDRAEPHGGHDEYSLVGVVPFLGAVSDFGVDGFGAGFTFAVPYVRGGKEVEDPGPGAFHMRDGNSQALWISLGAAYEYKDIVAIGVTGALVHSQWRALVDSDTLPSLDTAIKEQGEEPGYTDDLLESPDYTATLDFDDLSTNTWSFSAGIRVRPVENLAIGVTYIHGAHVDNTGDASVAFQCPPQSDTIGRYGVEDLGLCYATVGAKATVSYDLPRRVHLGVAYFPSDAVRLEVMGGWVQWSVFQDFEVDVADADAPTPEAAELVNQHRYWARANNDSLWGALDGKVRVGEQVTLGARVLYDQAAVPDEALSTNNYDADMVAPTVLAAVRLGPMELGASYTHQFLATRTIDNSKFAMGLPEPDLSQYETDRWYYPHANGKYSGSVNRIGVQVRAKF